MTHFRSHDNILTWRKSWPMPLINLIRMVLVLCSGASCLYRNSMFYACPRRFFFYKRVVPKCYFGGGPSRCLVQRTLAAVMHHVLYRTKVPSSLKGRVKRMQKAYDDLLLIFRYATCSENITFPAKEWVRRERLIFKGVRSNVRGVVSLSNCSQFVLRKRCAKA